MLSRIILNLWIIALLCGCVQPPFNNFQKMPPKTKPIVIGTGVGALAGGLIGNAATGAALGGALVGGAIGLGLGTANSIYHTTKPAIIDELTQTNIQYIEYGDSMTLIVPTDHYFVANSSQLNDICFRGLNAIIKLLALYPCSQIYVSGFTDDVGSQVHQLKLSRAQAETMLTFLWANNIKAKYLNAAGYGAAHTIGDNHWIHGSAYNRRIEIKWFNAPQPSHNFWQFLSK